MTITPPTPSSLQTAISYPVPTYISAKNYPPFIPFPTRSRNLDNLSYPTCYNSHLTFTGGLWNCQSAVNKSDIISGHSLSQSLDFLALTETWILPENTASPAALSSAFSFSHTPRASGRRGGGTGLLTSPKWTYTVTPLSHLSLSSFEAHAVSVSLPTILSVIIIYRPPGHLDVFLDEMDTLLSSFSENGTPLLLLGDFNIPAAILQSPVFCSFFASFDLTLSPSPPTHKAGNLLDLVFSRSCCTSNLSVTPLPVSDHHFITFSLSITLPSPSSAPTHSITTRCNLHTLSPTALSSAVLSILPSVELFSTLSTYDASTTLFSSLSAALDSLCPLITKPARSSPPAPWLSEPLRTRRTELRAAERKWKKSRDPDDLSAYHLILSNFTSAISAAKSSFFISTIQSSSSNLSKLFSTFTSLLNPPPPPPPSTLTADDFMIFFNRKVEDIRSSLPPPSVITSNSSVTSPLSLTPPSGLSSFSPLSPDETLHLVLSNSATSCPLDPIPSSLLQAIAADISPFLTAFINSSLSSGTIPSLLKTARIKPLLKKPSLDTSITLNYRPISLLSFLSKTLERAVSEQLSLHLSRNNLLDPFQSGFKPNHSTETALLSVTHALLSAKASSLSSVLILLDLSAAFDTVNHPILLSTLSHLGVSGTALSWFTSYLSDRSYQVIWQGSLSQTSPLITGVPQGSVLGPLLFLLYTHSLSQVITSHGFSYHAYADDTQLFLSFPPSDTQIESRLASCLSDVETWMSAHQLKLNLSKTVLLFFPTKDSPLTDLSLHFNNTTILPSQSAKNLGVIMDNQLSYSTFITATARACRFAMYNIRRIRSCLTTDATQLLVQALVLSRLDYCNVLLAGLPASATRPLQLVQNAAARLVFNLPKFSHVTPLFQKLHWLPILARIRFKTLALAYKAIHLTAPVYLQPLVNLQRLHCSLRTSTRTVRLAPPVLGGTQGRSSRKRLFSTLAPQWWNELPHSVTSAASLPIFRKRLKTHLFILHLGPPEHML